MEGASAPLLQGQHAVNGKMNGNVTTVLGKLKCVHKPNSNAMYEYFMSGLTLYMEVRISSVNRPFRDGSSLQHSYFDQLHAIPSAFPKATTALCCTTVSFLLLKQRTGLKGVLQ